MVSPLSEIAINLAAAWAAGSLIGLERSHNGRAAGFRTHAVVALASAAAMAVTFEPQVIPGALLGAARLDPGRIAQGVMTGVGFIGAGVIFKEGVSIQGLTTAASIWSTAAVGLLMGLGLYAPGAMVAVAVLTTLVVFRWFEGLLPEQAYALAQLRFHAGVAPNEEALRELLGRASVSLIDPSYHLDRDGEIFEYRGILQSRRKQGLATLAEQLRSTPGLVEYQLSRISK